MVYVFIATSIWLLCTSTLAQHLSRYCPTTDLCYQLNIPHKTATTGTGDIYLQISASSAYSWIALGQGSQMAGSNMFVVYSDGQGNVTLSPRRGVGHVEPLYTSAVDVTLLDGSGIADGRIVANFRCGNCAQWESGTMDFSSNGADWIYAHLSGKALQDSSRQANIKEHNAHGSFTWDFTSAKGGTDENPFVSTTSNSNTTNISASPALASPPSGGTPSASDTVVLVHGVLAVTAFVGFFTIGAILQTPIVKLSKGYRIHGAFQIFGYCIFVTAAGLGIFIANLQEQLDKAHSIIGMILLGLLTLQPFSGLLHHHLYKKTHKRSAASYAHVWIGRGSILLGLVNGGLGLKLAADDSTKNVAVYGSFAGAMGLLYLAAATYGEFKRKSSDAAEPVVEKGAKVEE